MKRVLQWIYFLYVALGFAILILATFPLAILLKLLPKKIEDRGMFFILKTISNMWFLMSGWFQKNYHRKQIDFGKSYLFMPNHQSFLDAAVLYASMPKPFKTLGKVEIEKTPFYGFIYKMVVITVDRSSVTAKANSIRKMKKELDLGISVGIFPEGTFADAPQEELLPFHNGAFSLAMMQQVDILPVLYLDSSRRMHPTKIYRLTPGLSRTVFLPPISIASFKKEELNDLKEQTRAYMQACLQYCRSHDPQSAWNFALEWKKKNNLV